MYESFEPWHLRDDYKVKKVHAHSPPLSKNSGWLRLQVDSWWFLIFLAASNWFETSLEES